MQKPVLALSLLALLGLGACRSLSGPPRQGPRVVHNVFFVLKEDTPAMRARLIEGCYRNLSSIDGVEYLAAGERDESLTRDANDLEFDVALTVVFRDRAAMDRYLPDARHQRLIADNKDNLGPVRVFDSFEGPARR